MSIFEKDGSKAAALLCTVSAIGAGFSVYSAVNAQQDTELFDVAIQTYAHDENAVCDAYYIDETEESDPFEENSEAQRNAALDAARRENAKAQAQARAAALEEKYADQAIVTSTPAVEETAEVSMDETAPVQIISQDDIAFTDVQAAPVDYTFYADDAAAVEAAPVLMDAPVVSEAAPVQTADVYVEPGVVNQIPAEDIPVDYAVTPEAQAPEYSEPAYSEPAAQAPVDPAATAAPDIVDPTYSYTGEINEIPMEDLPADYFTPTDQAPVEEAAPEQQAPAEQAPAPEAQAPAPAEQAPAPVDPSAQIPTQDIPDGTVVDVPAAQPDQSQDYSALNANIAQAAQGLVGVTDGLQCTEVVQLALAGAGISDAMNLWPNEYAAMYGYYTDNPQPGNLIYYNQGGNGKDHIAVYLGNGMALHGNYTANGVTSTRIAPVIVQGCSDYAFIQVCR